RQARRGRRPRRADPLARSRPPRRVRRHVDATRKLRERREAASRSGRSGPQRERHRGCDSAMRPLANMLSATLFTPALLVAPAAPADTSKARTLTALDDARACTPLASGGFAVATGGGLAILGADGAVMTLTSLDGLPDTRVHAVVESSDGLWAGT